MRLSALTSFRSAALCVALAAGFGTGARAADALAAPAVPVCATDELFGSFAAPAGIVMLCPITLDAGVSTKTLSRRVVHKVAGGVETDVVIATTSSGTYSTDALLTPNARYRGVHVTLAAEPTLSFSRPLL
jgi:hypothetical protein